MPTKPRRRSLFAPLLLLSVVIGCAQAVASNGTPPATSAPADSALGAAPRPPTEQIRVTFASDSAICAPHFIALDKGYYAEEGIEMEIVKAGGGAATPALISGDVQYSTSAASALSAMLQGAPIKVIYTNTDRSSYELWSTSSDIRTLRDLVGKSVGIHTRGDSNEVAARIALERGGVDPASVSYAAVGGGAPVHLAFQTGSVAGIVLSTSDVVQLRDSLAKGHRLADMKRDVQMLYTGLVASDRELQEHAERVKRFLRGTVKGREYYKAFREESLAILDKYNDNTHDANEADYDGVLEVMTEDGSMPPDVQRIDAEVRATLNGLGHIPPVEQMYTYDLIKQVYQELRASGWKPN